MRGFLQLALVAAFAIFPAGTMAETLMVTGIYPAGNDRAAALDSIAVEQFGGVDGGTLSIKIEDRLRGAIVDGDPWFTIYAASLSSDAEAALRGAVTTRVDVEDSYDKTVEDCIKRDAKKKCVEKRKRKIRCHKLVVRVDPTLRLVGRNGDLIDTDESSATREQRFCMDERRPDSEPLVEAALDEVADRLRYALAPVQRSEGIRVLESRKGMPKAAGGEFRDAIRQTKSDELGACASFAALEPAIGEHESLLFNIGLCAEAAGDFDAAEGYYRRAIAVDGSSAYASLGLARIDERLRAFDQMDSRN
ncbi:tetratricopeptide repeat protein [Parerythrobacter aestuarii]|uniref:hypothetical protein n=1 Tax=Parerythrobacter aestuarii TaxID=3020909 RepID=UPI0024DEAC6D|nr:hypothetical protein [Parerythrobacter aestuarii]